MPDDTTKSVHDLINDISFRFNKSDIYYGHGTDNAFDEAVYLVYSILDIPFDTVDERLNQLVNVEDIGHVYDLALRRITERIPVAYLVNKAWFLGMPFFVDERVLIPRSPIAELIEENFQPWLTQIEAVNNILDIGTGSGCIAIASAMVFNHAVVEAIDISNDALDVARINIDKYNLGARVNLIKSDLYQGLGNQTYDLIIANPPYVDAADMRMLPAEYRHEPGIGLAAGDDGLLVIRRIISESKQHLTKHGLLIVEVGNSQEAVEKAFPDIPSPHR
jgi:ribosomal protein L3 glutamine methyltransferase